MFMTSHGRFFYSCKSNLWPQAPDKSTAPACCCVSSSAVSQSLLGNKRLITSFWPRVCLHFSPNPPRSLYLLRSHPHTQHHQTAVRILSRCAACSHHGNIINGEVSAATDENNISQKIKKKKPTPDLCLWPTTASCFSLYHIWITILKIRKTLIGRFSSHRVDLVSQKLRPPLSSSLLRASFFFQLPTLGSSEEMECVKKRNFELFKLFFEHHLRLHTLSWARLDDKGRLSPLMDDSV